MIRSVPANLADNYEFKGGNYQLQYVGGGISGLQTTRKVNFSVSRD
ncbi:hypothetical protein ABIC45_002880 [Mucilaginibacter rubeus]